MYFFSSNNNYVIQKYALSPEGMSANTRFSREQCWQTLLFVLRENVCKYLTQTIGTTYRQSRERFSHVTCRRLISVLKIIIDYYQKLLGRMVRLLIILCLCLTPTTTDDFPGTRPRLWTWRCEPSYTLLESPASSAELTFHASDSMPNTRP
jgi:hypothetical protein